MSRGAFATQHVASNGKETNPIIASATLPEPPAGGSTLGGNMNLGKKLTAEFLGTFWLVLGGCGSAVLAANFGGDGNPFGIGFVGVSLAFGLTVLTGAYAFGHISGGHFNPAVSLGLWAGGRFPARELLPYIVAQVLGGIAAGFILLQIAKGGGGFMIDPTAAGAFATNGYDALSPGGYTVAAAFLCEVVLTAFFLIVIMGSTHRNAPTGFAPIAIGLALTLIHLISIPVTNTSVNPARSTAVAVFVGNGALSQLWLFWLAPILGALIGGMLYGWLGRNEADIVGNR
jgi:aquaporin Z